MSEVIRVQRACNGCGRLLRDATDAEFTFAVCGVPLPDVRSECEHCSGAVRGDGEPE